MFFLIYFCLTGLCFSGEVLDFFWASIRERPPYSIDKSTPQTTLDWEQRALYFNSYIARGLLLDENCPEKTPLNIHDFGIAVDETDFYIKKIVFESEPKNYVTANLYIPKNVSYPVPAMILNHGHSGGKHTYMQTGALTLVKKGYAVLLFDHLGYGERKPKGYNHESDATYFFLIGGFKTLETWTVIRAIDYLVTLPEIDPVRIGFHGLSGGGTQTHFMAMANLIEPRLKLFVPAGAISSWETMTWPTSGHCQCNVLANLAGVMEHSDTLSMPAKHGGAVRIITGSLDPLQATQTDPLGSGKTAFDKLLLTSQNMKNVFSLYGNIYADMFNPPIVHTYDENVREELLGFCEWFFKNNGDGTPVSEPSYTPYDESILNCYPSGKVPQDALTPAELLQVRLENMKSGYILPQTPSEFKLWQSKLRAIIKNKVFGKFPQNKPLNAIIISSSTTPEYDFQKIVIETESIEISDPPSTYKIRVPFYLILPEDVSFPRPLVVALHQDGKDVLFNGTTFYEQSIEEFVRTKKFIVVCPDVRNTGETKTSSDIELAKWSTLYGKPIFGRQVYDIIRVIDYIISTGIVDEEKIAIAGYGGYNQKLAPMLALYTSALDSRIKVTVCEGGMPTYNDIYWSEDQTWQWCHPFIPVFVTPYADIPQIAGLIAPRALCYCAVESSLQKKNKFTGDEIESIMSWTKTAYSFSGASTDSFKFTPADNWDGMTQNGWQTINNWLYQKLEELPSTLSPSIQVTADKTITSLGTQIQFYADATTPNGTISSYNWDFSDTGSSILKNPTHIYNSEGVFDVFCTVTDSSGSIATDLITVAIYGGAGTPSKILLSAQPEKLFAEETEISLITARITDSDGNTVNNSTETVTFSLSGCGLLTGPATVKCTAGIANIIYRAGNSTGTATITAFSEGLSTGSVTINVLENTNPGAYLSVTPSLLDFGEVNIGKTKTIILLIRNTGGGILAGKLTSDMPWILLSQNEFSSNEINIQVTVDNSLLNMRKGNFSGKIIIESNGGIAIIPVKLTATCVFAYPDPYYPSKSLLNFSGSGFIHGKTTIKIWTVSGTLIKTIKDKNSWDGTDEQGKSVPSGVYIFSYETPTEKGISKFTLLRSEPR